MISYHSVLDREDISMHPKQHAKMMVKEFPGITIGLAQFLVLVPHTSGLIMLTGDVDDNWHSILQNPNYDDFCKKNFGQVVIHQSGFIGSDKHIEETIRILEIAYGKDLDKDLSSWRQEYLYGVYGVCAFVRLD